MSEPGDPPSTARLGGPSLLLAPIVGLGLAIGQDVALLTTWRYCIANPGGPPVIDVWIGGGIYVGIIPLVIRFLAYAGLFVLGFVGCDALRSRGRAGRMALGWFVGLALCMLAFALDFSLTSGMGPGSYVPWVCPGGRPPWWPF